MHRVVCWLLVALTPIGITLAPARAHAADKRPRVAISVEAPPRFRYLVARKLGSLPGDVPTAADYINQIAAKALGMNYPTLVFEPSVVSPAAVIRIEGDTAFPVAPGRVALTVRGQACPIEATLNPMRVGRDGLTKEAFPYFEDVMKTAFSPREHSGDCWALFLSSFVTPTRVTVAAGEASTDLYDDFGALFVLFGTWYFYVDDALSIPFVSCNMGVLQGPVVPLGPAASRAGDCRALREMRRREVQGTFAGIRLGGLLR